MNKLKAAVPRRLNKAVYREREIFDDNACTEYRKRKCAMLTVLLIVLFLIGFVRALWVSYCYSRPECLEFFDYYMPRNPGQFDYSIYLKSMGVSSREQYELMKNGDPAPPPLYALLESFRTCCMSILDNGMTPHDAGICKAVVLGDKSEMDKTVRDLYQDAGIAHLLAVSGLHVSMIGSGIYRLISRLMPKKQAAYTVSVILFLYMLMTGASGSVVRAVIMLIMNLAAAVYYREYCMRTAISVSAMVLMLYRPYIIFTSGFQLSFGAVCAISFVGQSIIRQLELMRENAESTGHFRKKISRRNRLKPIFTSFIISTSIQAVTLPMIAYHFYKFPVYGILLNFIVIPLMTAVLGSGIAVITVGLIRTSAAALMQSSAMLTGQFPGVIKECLSGIDQEMSFGVTHLSDIVLTGFTDHSTGLHGSMIWKLLTDIAAAPGHYVLLLYEFLSSESLKLPYASVCIGRPSHMQILLYYILLLIGLLCIFRTHNITAVAETDVTSSRADNNSAFTKCLADAISFETEPYSGNKPIKNKSIRLKPIYIKRNRIRLCTAAAALLLLFCSNILKYRDSHAFYVMAVDVGQGDCLLIKNDDSYIMYDGGSSSRKNIGQYVIEPLLLSRGIDSLDMAVISHADADHINGIEYLLSEASDVNVERLLLPQAAAWDEAYDDIKTAASYGRIDDGINETVADGWRNDETKTAAADSKTHDGTKSAAADNEMYDSIKAVYAGREANCGVKSAASDSETSDDRKTLNQGTEGTSMVYACSPGQLIAAQGDFKLGCWYPGSDSDDINSQSLVLYLQKKKFTMLLTGDTSKGDEESFCSEAYITESQLHEQLPSDGITVLKAAHHGSRTSNSDIIFNTFKPKAVLISCGRDNRYGHPHEEVLERAAYNNSRIIRTDQSGAVTISIRGDTAVLEPFLKQ